MGIDFIEINPQLITEIVIEWKSTFSFISFKFYLIIYR
jgi:hypothetical protein